MNTLALKYRPRVLTDLVGQEASVRALFNALKRAKASGAIHHQAFLFAGVRGTGKTSTARILARALNCQEGPTAEPCGRCDACLASERPDQNLDVIEIDAASRASVEDARALREQVQTRPAFCRYRVYIIDEVHMLSRSAFDALLKILEEPPSHAVFVLATTELQDVPDTIKSRVQIYPFRLIPVALIEQRLKDVCDQEGVQCQEGSLRLVAEAGQGSMRDALTTLDRVIAAGDGQVLEDGVREQLGIVPAVRVQGMLEAIAAGDGPGVLEHCAALESLGADWISFWRELMLAFRVRLEEETRRGAGPHEMLRWSRMLHLLLQRERDLRDSSLPQVVVELALLTAAQLPHLAPLDSLVQPGAVPAAARPAPSGARPAPAAPAAPPPPARDPGPAPASREPARTLASAAPVAPAAPAAPAPSAAPLQPLADTGNLEALRRGLSEAFRQTPGLSRSMAAIPRMATELKVEGHALHLYFPPTVRNTVQELEEQQANPRLLETLRQLLPGLQRLAVTFEQTAGLRPEDQLREDPVFQRLMHDVGGEILDVRRDGE